jgi:hypothetical protein
MWLTPNQTLPLAQFMEDHMPNKHYSQDFSSRLLLTSQQTLRLAQLIGGQMPNEHHSAEFCSFLRLTSKQKFLFSAHPNSHG